MDSKSAPAGHSILTAELPRGKNDSILYAHGRLQALWPRRGDFHLPRAFCRMKIGPFLAESVGYLAYLAVSKQYPYVPQLSAYSSIYSIDYTSLLNHFLYLFNDA